MIFKTPNNRKFGKILLLMEFMLISKINSKLYFSKKYANGNLYEFAKSRNYSTQKSIPYIMNKKNSMDQIRLTIANSIKPIYPNKKKRYFVCATHTYPAWRKIFSVSKNLRSISNNLKKESHSANNPYGHTLVDFFCTHSLCNNYINVESDIVVNIGTLGPNGINKRDFMHFFLSEKYYFNNYQENLMVTGNQQGGISERSFVSIIYEIDEITWVQMQKFYTEIKKHSLLSNSYNFSLGLQLIINPMRKIADYLARMIDKNLRSNLGITFLFGLDYLLYGLLIKIAQSPEKGNCCYWISKGFKEVKMIDTCSNFPMVFFYKILICLLFRKTKYFFNVSDKPLDYSIVFYRGLKHNNISSGLFIYPFYWIRRKYEIIWKPEKMANIEVKLAKVSEVNNNFRIEIEKKSKRENVMQITSTIEYIKKILKIR